MHRLVGTADRVDVAGARHALDLGLDGVRDLPELVGAALRIPGPERHAQDRHVVDALRLDQRLQDADVRPGASPGWNRWRCRGARSRRCGPRRPRTAPSAPRRPAARRNRCASRRRSRRAPSPSAWRPGSRPGRRSPQGTGTMTFAIVTLICGSSSRGVTSTAKTPSSSAVSPSSGVSWLSRKNAREPAADAELLSHASTAGCRAWMPAAAGSSATRSPAASPARISTRSPRA